MTKIEAIFSYVPYKYDTAKFVYVGSLSRDHIDPSIFCVLTAPSKQTGISVADFLIFGERWDVASNTFRPPVSIICGYSLIIVWLFWSTTTGTLLVSFWDWFTGHILVVATTSCQVCTLIISRLRNELIHIIGGASFETGFCPHGGVYDPFPLSHGPSFNFDNSWLWSLECCIKYGLSSWKDIQGQFEWALPSVCLINGGTDIPTLLQWSCLSLACPSLLPTMPWIVVVSNMVCLAMMFCRAA